VTAVPVTALSCVPFAMPRGITIGCATTLLAALAGAAGCGLSGRDLAFVEREDVALALPTARAGADDVQGEAHELAVISAAEIDGWVADVVDATAGVVAELDDHRETRRDGAFGLYGPFDDPLDRDVTWLVKIADADEPAIFEVWVGPPGAGEGEVALATHGHLASADGDRSGEITIEYDVLERHPDLRPRGERLAGAVTVAFERAADSARIELRFAEFVGEDSATSWSDDDTLVHERDADGGALHATFGLDAEMVSGVVGELAIEQIEIDARWDASTAGRVRARAPRSANAENPALPDDLLLHECFDAAGGLTFRELNEPYAADRPAYALGDASTCVFADTDLDAT
jgi:hypothetical protein